MKKRVKLFTTIASLCLAVALMAFGVYAATNVYFTASGTVKFEVTNVFVKAETTVYKAKNAAGKRVANPQTADYEETAHIVTDTRSSLVDGNWTDLENYAIGELNFGVAGAYKIVVVLTNLSVERGITVDSHAPNGDELVNATIVEDTNNASKTAINASTQSTPEKATFTYYVSITDVAKVSSGSWSIAINLSQTAA